VRFHLAVSDAFLEARTQGDLKLAIEKDVGIRGVKYLYKYVFKEHDRARLQVSTDQQGQTVDPMALNEPQMYLDARWISAPESVWCLLGLTMHSHNPSVVRLQVHLEGLQPVYYDTTIGQERLERLSLEPRSRSTLSFVAAILRSRRLTAICLRWPPGTNSVKRGRAGNRDECRDVMNNNHPIGKTGTW